MPKELKYKRGFTLRHYFDEWWDRRPHEWKIRLGVFTVLVVAVVGATFLFWVHRRVEREELLAEAKKLHEKRIQGVDSRIGSEAATLRRAMIPPSDSLQVRSGE